MKYKILLQISYGSFARTTSHSTNLSMNMDKSQNWYKDNFIVSTDKSLLQPAAINAAFDSDLLWWAKPLPDEQLKKMIDNTLCFGLYVVPVSSTELAGSYHLLPGAQ
jgi:hypothetical protein